MPHPTTFSIVAAKPAEKIYGIAVASKFLAVGALVPWAASNSGAVATQSFVNTAYGPDGLELMRKGLTAQDTLARLTQKDPQAHLRQAGMVDLSGGSATFTGSGCYAWAGGVTGPGYAIQGNMLAGPQVVEAMQNTFLDTASLPFHWRLHASLLAGDRAGGDRRGRQSAAILVVKPSGGYGGFNDRWVDYRVDDHPDPIQRLGELLALFDLYFGKSPENDRVYLQGEPLLFVQKIMAKLGYYSGPIHGIYDEMVRTAFEAFTGNENFEERVNLEQGWLDAPVYAYMKSTYKE